MDTSLPLWWPVTAGPALVALGAPRPAGAAWPRPAPRLSLLATAIGADVARSPDRARGQRQPQRRRGAGRRWPSACASSRSPACGCWLVSCGAEEVLQGGIYGFAARHFPGLDRERTWMLNLDTIGSPELVMIEGEGAFVMEDYFDRRFRDLIARAAERVGLPIRRGLRSRSSSDCGDSEPGRLPDRDALLDRPLQVPVQLPPDVRHPRERRLRHDRPGGRRSPTAVGRELAGAR